MKFRIKYIRQIGFFAQVKKGLVSNWKTIGKHVHGYGLYEQDYIDHPIKSDLEAEERCKLYEQWLYYSKNNATYYDV